MNMSKVNETKDFEKYVLEKFHKLKVSVKIDVLNILLLVTTDKVLGFQQEKRQSDHRKDNDSAWRKQ